MPFNDDPWMLPTSVERVAGTVHHYTTRAGFLGLVQGGAFWASEYRSLNDLSEIRHGWGLIEDWLSKQKSSHAVDEIRKATDLDERPREVFVISASLEGDDANQWRLYAEDCRGYSVGIATSVPLAIRKATNREKGYDTFGSMLADMASVSPWLRVTYDDQAVATHLDNLANDLTSAIAQIESTDYGGNDDGAPDDYASLREAAFAAVATIAALSKPAGFRGESEARIVATMPHGGDHYRYRTGDAGVFPYVPIARRPDDSFTHVVDLDSPKLPLPITSVRLGPRLRKENIESVQLLLRAARYEKDTFVLSKSEVPLA